MSFIKLLLTLLQLHTDVGSAIDPNGAVFERLVADGVRIDPEGHA